MHLQQQQQQQQQYECVYCCIDTSVAFGLFVVVLISFGSIAVVRQVN